MTEVNGQRRPPQNRSDWDRHREQVRRTNRARQRAEKRLREEKAERWAELYAQEALKEGVTPQQLPKAQQIEREIAKLQAKLSRLVARDDDKVVEVGYRSRPRVNLVGQRFGQLVVIEQGTNVPGTSSKRRSEARWVCECDCGNRTLVRVSNLKNGHTTTCGWHRRLEEQDE